MKPYDTAKDKWFIEFKFSRVILRSEKETLIFKYLLDMIKYMHKRYKVNRARVKKVQIFTNDFDLLKKYYADKKDYYYLEPIKVCVSSKVFGFRLFKFLEFIDTRYKYGTDEYSAEEIFNSVVEFSRYNSGFTGYAKKEIYMDLIKKEFKPMKKDLRQIMVNQSVKGPIIACRPLIEFINPFCYDLKSAYPYWIDCLEFPYEFNQSTTFVNTPHMIHFCRIIIKDLKVKKPYYAPLFLKQCGIEEDDIDVMCDGRRIMAAKQYSGYVFLEDFQQIIKNYTYSSIEIDWTQFWNCPTKLLPKETRDKIRQLFDRKEETKAHSDKLILNRTSYGLFITHKGTKDGKDAADYTVPYQVGIYIVSHQAAYMDSIIEKCGVEHLIAAHTDSIKFDYDISKIVEEENKKRETYKNLGLWEKEKYKCCCYYSNTKAKLIKENGELEIKHGGISESDVKEFLMGKTYDEINADTEIMLTINKEIVVSDKGTHIILNKTKSIFTEEC